MQAHSFHIPVMGTGYTIDTPVKVAHLGINSVISIVDDMLIEKMREFYCKQCDIPYHAISSKINDFRAKRITAYLNLMNQIVKEKFDRLKNSVLETEIELKKYFDLLPDFSALKQNFQDFIQEHTLKTDLINWLEKNLIPGNIDVNIMTKVDKENYRENEKLPVEFNDAHAALRGFANSDLDSAIVLSAGMNPRLYGYMENFRDFYPDKNGYLKKRIILKVSDFRSALIQGKFLAKKGLWVSEYRIESGLNCGGHAFATDGNLMGPILEEFKNSRDELTVILNDILSTALNEKSIEQPEKPLSFKVTAQGGVGTNMEQQFLMDHYKVDSVGWGSPFLLVDDVVNIDEKTKQLIADAKEEDLYLSYVSPLGVPFNNVRGNSKDEEKMHLVSRGIPGSTCPKQLLIQSREYSERPLCTASKKYQKLKLKDLVNEKNQDPEQFKRSYLKITDKACLCMGLSDTAMHLKGFKKPHEKVSASICPGPNIAYFTEKVSLKTMVDHIYGRLSIIKRNDRPNLFIKELSLYIDYLKERISESKQTGFENMIKYFEKFKNNLVQGIEYYITLFSKNPNKISGNEAQDICSLKDMEEELKCILPVVNQD